MPDNDSSPAVPDVQEPKALSCPQCGAAVVVDLETYLPEHADMTLTLTVERGQMIQLKTLAGFLDNFAKIQEEVGKAMECETTVFLAGMKMTDTEISVTSRIANTVKGRVEPTQGALFEDTSHA